MAACASVHAQRFEQLAKRNDVIAQVFENHRRHHGARTRHRRVLDPAHAPASVNADSIQALKDAGLNDGEILDLLHSDAIFAWANRLMLNLGEPVYAAPDHAGSGALRAGIHPSMSDAVPPDIDDHDRGGMPNHGGGGLASLRAAAAAIPAQRSGIADEWWLVMRQSWPFHA